MSSRLPSLAPQRGTIAVMPGPPPRATKPILQRMLGALWTLSRGTRGDALGDPLERSMCALDAARTEAEIDAVRSAVDAWLAQMLGHLLSRVETHLAGERQDLSAVRHTLRALWLLLRLEIAADARNELVPVGRALSAALDAGREADARCVQRQQLIAWWARHQTTVAIAVKRWSAPA